MKITCPHCDINITVKQKYLYHAGFSNLGFLYCDLCSNILEFGSFNSNYIQIVGEKHPWKLSKKEKRLVESRLNSCSCGGKFKFDLYPRCPNCKESLESIIPDKIHFLEIGDVIDGDTDEDVWLDSK